MTTIKLRDGLKVDNLVHYDVELRKPSAGDIMDAGTDAERLVSTADGYVLLMSPATLALHLLRRQIKRIGDYPGPLTLAELRMLSAHDLELLRSAADALDAALLSGLDSRGRDKTPRRSAG